MGAMCGRSGDTRRVIARLACLVCLASSCTHAESVSAPREPAHETPAPTYEPPPRVQVQTGYASWYGAALAGHRTANGERFDPGKMTAAHRTLPFGTWVEVRRAESGDAVRVRITDRGPFGHEDRIIDLSRAAAEKLGMVKAGVARVQVRVVDGP
jgi:rare lipoprotein A